MREKVIVMDEKGHMCVCEIAYEKASFLSRLFDRLFLPKYIQPLKIKEVKIYDYLYQSGKRGQ